jgi:dCTP deaminase
MTAQGILSDLAICRAIELGHIRIDPFKPEHVNPASYDLTLGKHVGTYDRWVSQVPFYQHDPMDGNTFLLRKDMVLDVRDKPTFSTQEIDPEVGWVLKPGIGYLMHTEERIWTERYVPIVDGKSSIGRLFIQIHATAGYGDPGFDGQYTLEVLVAHPVRVYPGMRIGQIRFHTLAGEVGTNYKATGNYKNHDAIGPVPSKAYKQFEKKT